jgi:hypothetical protein
MIAQDEQFQVVSLCWFFPQIKTDSTSKHAYNPIAKAELFLAVLFACGVCRPWHTASFSLGAEVRVVGWVR